MQPHAHTMRKRELVGVVILPARGAVKRVKIPYLLYMFSCIPVTYTRFEAHSMWDVVSLFI